MDTFDGYQIFISPPPPPPLTSPIFVAVMPISGMYLLQGLANFTTYTITVATYNQDGVGPRTASHSATTPEAGVCIQKKSHVRPSECSCKQLTYVHYTVGPHQCSVARQQLQLSCYTGSKAVNVSCTPFTIRITQSGTSTPSLVPRPLIQRVYRLQYNDTESDPRWGWFGSGTETM